MPFKLIDLVNALPRSAKVPQRDRKGIDGIAIHHSGDENGPQAWSRYHTSAPDQGGPSWGPSACIGYHAVIMRDGRAFKVAHDSDQTSGVAHHNHHLIHIVLQGNLEQTPPTEIQIAQLLRTVRVYMNAYAIPVERIRTHGEWQDDPAWATSCPGIAWIGAMVRGVFAKEG